MIVRELEDGVVIRRVTDDADDWRAAFTGAYQTVFAGPPYFERYYPSEAEGIYRKLTGTPGSIVLLATQGLTRVVGFGVAIPLAAKPPVAVELTGLVPIQHTMYLAELGVLDEFRGHGMGKVLVQERLAAMDRNNFSHVVLRVSAGENPSSRLYKELGFEEMGVYTEVSSKRNDGRVKTDRRLFLSKVLSQVGL
jgi:ribosomal protein S18 acetylase RimI-like enzyme